MVAGTVTVCANNDDDSNDNDIAKYRIALSVLAIQLAETINVLTLTKEYSSILHCTSL